MIVQKHFTTLTIATTLTSISTQAIAQSDSICLIDQRFSRVDLYPVGEHPG